jgi:hypothetical protein
MSGRGALRCDWRSDGCVLSDSVTGQKGETAHMTDEASNSAADGCWADFDVLHLAMPATD